MELPRRLRHQRYARLGQPRGRWRPRRLRPRDRRGPRHRHRLLKPPPLPPLARLHRLEFVSGYDFVDHDPFANDRNGHGTQVAGTIAEATGNHYGLTGLAYGVRMMPVRVLDSEGEGDAAVIAQGVRFAVNHGARVINL